MGCIAALKHNTWIDWVLTSAVSTAGIALPNYVVGFLLIEIFAVRARAGCRPAAGVSHRT